jgi:hypothetical protein
MSRWKGFQDGARFGLTHKPEAQAKDGPSLALQAYMLDGPSLALQAGMSVIAALSKVGTAVLALLLCAPPALPCSLCGSSVRSQTLSQDAAYAKLVLFGTLANAKVTADGGVTDLQIEKVIKSDPFLGDKKVVKLPRYVTVDPKTPKFIIFCDIFNGKIDPYRGVQAASAAIAEYVEKARAIDAKDRTKALLFFFDYLDHSDNEIANDAFQEFARSTDQEIGQVAGKLSAQKLRTWILDPRTPSYRVDLYAFLLGACGTDQDAALLRTLLTKPKARTNDAISGTLSGYIALRPREGWDLARTMLADSERPFKERYAVVLAVRFQHGWKPKETEAEVLRCLGGVLDQGDMADVVIEDLRRWQLWNLTDNVLAQYGKKSHSAPIMRRCVVRYALSCPKPEASLFVAAVRKLDPDMVGDVEESLQLENKK